MRTGEALLCRDTERRARLQHANQGSGAPWNGLDYVEYECQSGCESALLAYFLCELPDLSSKDFGLQSIDGRTTYSIKAPIQKVGPRCVRLVPEKPLCRPQTYRLKLHNLPNIDPQFSAQEFTATDDEVEVDPRPSPPCPPRLPQEPQINYLARDFSSLRQLLLDRLALLIPDWKERHVPDLGMTLVELLACVGDYLAYYQDAVATEAYSNTARQRISVRRHARLVDYQLHEGCNARNFVHVRVSAREVPLDPRDAFFITAHPDEKYQGQVVLPATALEQVLPDSYQAFEPQPICPATGPLRLFAAHNEIAFYTWDQRQCCLPAGATRATLKDPSEPIKPPVPETFPGCDIPSEVKGGPIPDASAIRCFRSAPEAPVDVLSCGPCAADQQFERWDLRHMAAGQVLLLEEVLGPETHVPADADPHHRWVVRLTRVQPCVDRLTGQRLVEIEWAADDALPFPLCISSVGPAVLGCQHNDRISIARGNMVLADHGRMIDQPEWLGDVRYRQPQLACDADDALVPAVTAPSRGELLRPVLKEADLTFAAPIDRNKSARKIFDQLPEDALPQLEVYGFPVANELADAFRPADVPPPTLVTFDDFAAPLNLLERFRSFDLDEQRRLEAMLSPTDARFLHEFGAAGAQSTLQQLTMALTVRAAAARKVTPAADCRSLNRPTEQPIADDDLAGRYDRFLKQLKAAMQWQVKLHLLDSDADDQHVVVEIDNERRCRLRFGDGQLGKLPPEKSSFYAKYRRGNGAIGNIGADKIQHVVFRRLQPGAIDAVRNPRPARGGVDFESLDHARLHAPRQFRKLRRAITAEDYAQLVREQFPDRVQQARATLDWTGMGFLAAVAIDPVAGELDHTKLLRDVERHLLLHRRIGHALRVSLPTYVGLRLSMTVCVAGGYLRAHVRQELLDRFSHRLRNDGTPGFFHSDNFSFGDALYLSRIVAAARHVPGVENVVVTRFERLQQGDLGEREAGVIEFGPLEIPRLDNDPLQPERGCLCLDMRGER